MEIVDIENDTEAQHSIKAKYIVKDEEHDEKVNSVHFQHQNTLLVMNYFQGILDD